MEFSSLTETEQTIQNQHRHTHPLHIGNTALNINGDAFSYAAANGHPNVMAAISQCCNYGKPSSETISDLLYNAAFKSNRDVIKLLVGVYCHKSFLQFDVARMLCDAASAGDGSAVKYISDLVSDPEMYCTNTADLPDFLLRDKYAQAGLISKTIDKTELLNFAVDQGLHIIASILLIHGPDINCKDEYGMSALHKAAAAQSYRSSTTAIQFLVANNCDINCPSNQGLRAIDYAIRARREDTVKLLIDSGCDLNLTDAEGRTPLHRAIQVGEEGVIKLLIDSGCDLNLADAEARTHIHHAIHAGRNDIVKLLIDSGCDLNLADAEGRTPLHRAVVQIDLDDSVTMEILEHERYECTILQVHFLCI